MGSRPGTGMTVSGHTQVPQGYMQRDLGLAERASELLIGRCWFTLAVAANGADLRF